MSVWVYDVEECAPKVRWCIANGQRSLQLDLPEEREAEYAGTDDYDGESLLFVGYGKEGALEWLRSAIAAVEAAPDA